MSDDSNGLKRYDLDEIRRAIKVLFTDAGAKYGNGECSEIRIPDKRKKITVSGWFDDPELFAKAVAKMARDGFGQGYKHVHENAYWTLNPCDDALLSRQPKNTLDFVADSTSDNNITRRNWFIADVDPLRPAGVSASDAEKALALSVVDSLSVKLLDIGFPESCFVIGDSGNGYHNLIRVDLPNDTESRDLLKKCLAAMQALVGTGKVEIDPKVFNAARIAKCYGTMSCKGVSTADRPWRMSRLLKVPDVVTICPRELLEKLATFAPDKDPKRDLGESTKRQGPWDAEKAGDYLKRVGWKCDEPKAIDGDKLMWSGDCITNSEHDHEAKFILHADGWVSYGCFHSSCAAVKHRDFFAYWDAELGEDIAYPGKRQSNWDWAGITDDNNADIPIEETPKEPKAFNLTDAGNMERLVHYYGHLFRYCPQSGWFSWNKHRWEDDKKGRIIRAALRVARLIIPNEMDLQITAEDEKGQLVQFKQIQKHALYSESRKGLVNTEFVSRSAPSLVANIGEFDQDLWLFNAANGTVDLRSFEFREHRQADMITNISPVDYDADAQCPLWLEFLDDIMSSNQELIGFLQRAAGISMTGSTVDHALYILWGTGRNGKSTFLEALRYPLGSYSMAASMSMFLQTKNETIPNDLAALAGARFVSAAESAEGRRLDEAKIKLLTGGDKVSARFLHKEFFEFTPHFKIWLATNHKPQIVGDDEAIWRRIKLIPFKVYIPDGKKDETLPNKLRSEASGILNWMLDGLREYHLGGLAEPDEVISATDHYRKSEDWLDRFLDSEVEKVDKELGRIQSRTLYTIYKIWAVNAGEKVLSERRFGDTMRDRGWEYKSQKGGSFVQGLRLRHDDMDSPSSQALEDLAKM